METKNVLGIIFSVLFIGAFAFVLSWGIINFNKVKDGMSGTGVYTQEDVNNAYEDGYNTALEDKGEYDELIDTYRDTITSQTDQISQLNSQIIILTNNNKDYATQVSNLESQKTSLEEQVENLNTIKSNNETTILQLNTQIAELEKEIADLENSGEDKDETIAQKNTQITNLQSTVSQLQKTNELNVETITNLNNQIASLNTQITDMTLQIQNNSTNVTALNNKIAELEKSVAYYEQYIANLENGEQVVATFEFNGSVYNIQIVNKNDTVSVVNPTSTDNVIFNYWTVNGEQIDLSTYQITSNVKIVANVTYKYDVKFMIDDTEYDSQIVIKNGYATIPTTPIKTGYEFDGWTTNGVDIVNPNTTIITQNTTYVAKFTKLHTVTFMYEDTTYTTQIVRNNECSSNVTVDSTDYKVFNGWQLNGAIVDVVNQKIVADTTFIADITYYYDVNFVVENETLETSIVQNNKFATTTLSPTKEHYVFIGWSIDGSTIVDLNTYVVNNSTTFIAVFEIETFTVSCLTQQFYGSTIGTKTVAYGEVIGDLGFEAPYKENYTFKYWGRVSGLTTVECDLNSYVVTSNISLVPVYEQTTFIVNFYDGDTLLSTQKINKGNNITSSPTPLGRSGFNFVGWTQGDYTSIVDFNTYNVNGDKTFYARYSRPYSGTYTGTVANGESVSLVIVSTADSAVVSYDSYVYFKNTDTTVYTDNGIYVDVSNASSSSAIWYTLKYNAFNNTWVYTKYVSYNGNTSHKDYVLSFTKSDTGIK